MILYSQPILDTFWKTFTPSKKAKLGIILVGNDQASQLYVSIKQDEAKKYGIETELVRFDQAISEDEVKNTIQRFNNNHSIHGIIVQLPLPKSLNRDAILQTIDPSKDVDNLTGRGMFTSPMVLAVKSLIHYYKLVLNGPLCVIGAGPLVGRPIRLWLEFEEKKVIIVDKNTPNADELIRSSNVLFCGAGREVIFQEDVNNKQIIFDCSGKDVDFDGVKNNVFAITPPKGGIGPLTVHFLLVNTLQAPSK